MSHIADEANRLRHNIRIDEIRRTVKEFRSYWENAPEDTDTTVMGNWLQLIKCGEDLLGILDEEKERVKDIKITISLLNDRKLHTQLGCNEQGYLFSDLIRIEAERLEKLVTDSLNYDPTGFNHPNDIEPMEPACASCGDTKKVCKTCGKNHFGKVYRHPYFLVPCPDCPPICDDCGKPMKKTGQVPEYGEEVGKPGTRIPVHMNELFECINLNCPNIGK